MKIGAGIGDSIAQLTGPAFGPALIASGRAGILAAVTQAPLTAFIIVMEMVDGRGLASAQAVCADVGTAKGRAATLDRAMRALGGLDILVNNAGGVRAGRLEDTTEADIEQMVAVDLLAPVLLTRAAMPALRAGGDAMVMNVASGIALVGAPFYTTYAAVKAGLARFGEALRRELKGEGIHVLTAYPGGRSGQGPQRTVTARWQASFHHGSGSGTTMARPRALDEAVALDAAIQCFWSRGYEATSVRDLADAMGIAGPSLYNTSGDKRTLYRRALDHYVERGFCDRVRRFESQLAPRAAIGAFVDEVIALSLADDQRRGCMIVRTRRWSWRPTMRSSRLRWPLSCTTWRPSSIAASRPARMPARSCPHVARLVDGVARSRARPEPELLRGLVRPALALLDGAGTAQRRSRR